MDFNPLVSIQRLLFVKLIFLFLISFLFFVFACGQKIKDIECQDAEESIDEKKINEWIDSAVEFEDVNIDSAIYFYQKAGKLADSILSYNGKIRFAYNYSVVLNNSGKFEESEQLNREALRLAQQENDTLNMAKGFNNIANTFNYRSLYDTAYVYYIQSVVYFKRVDFPKLYIIYSNIGAVLEGLERHDEAIDYYNKAYLSAKEMKDSLMILSILNNKGVALNFKSSQEEAIQTFQDAFRYIGYNKESLYTAQLYGNYANSLKQVGQLDSSLYYYQKSYDISKKQENSENLGIALQGFAQVYFQKMDYQRADFYGNEALEKLSLDPTHDKLLLYKLLADIKYHIGDHERSYIYFSRYITLRDILQHTEIQKTISQAEKKYQLSQKEEELLMKELQLTKSELQHRKKNWYIIVGLFLVVTLAGISYLLYGNIKQRNRLFIAERDSLHKEKEMSVLRAGLEGAATERFRIAQELHDDLGTGLTSIRFLAEKITKQGGELEVQISKKIQEATQSLTEQINEIIWSMNTERDTLDELLTFIRVKIATLLDGNDIIYKIYFPEDIPTITLSGFFRRNMYLLVKEAVHNAIKHSGADCIKIEVEVVPHLKIRIIDNGDGISIQKQEMMGNGLKNMEQRIRSLSGSWEIFFENGTVVYFDVPYPIS